MNHTIPIAYLPSDDWEAHNDPAFRIREEVVVVAQDDYNGEGRERYLVVAIQFIPGADAWDAPNWLYGIKPTDARGRVKVLADLRWCEEDELCEASLEFTLEDGEIPF